MVKFTLISRNIRNVSCLCMAFLFVLTGCQENEEVERVSVVPQILNDSIYTTMPGNMVVTQDYLVWSSPFSKENFLHVVDLRTGKEVGEMGKIGQGPEEFTTPGMGRIVRKNNVYVSDCNTNLDKNLRFLRLYNKKKKPTSLTLALFRT